ncbi:MAG: glycosyltransferase [Spirochaetaceae bacterium]
MSECILIVYLKTGGGHSSAARALAASFEEHPDTTAIPFNPIRADQRFVRLCVERSYNYMASRGRFLWPAFYTASAWAPLLTLSELSFSRSISGEIARAVETHGITKIVVVHFMCRRPVRSALRQIGASHIPVVQVVTDPFTAHRAWFHKLRYPCVVFSSRVRERAITTYGVNPDRLVQFPVILRKQFQTRMSDAEVREHKARFGFDPDKNLVLIAAGGEGLSRGGRVLEELARSREDYEIAVVCGNSASFKAEATRIARKHPHRRVIVYGFTEQMYELMNMADLIIGKAGPATVMEVLILHKPLILTGYMYGQEKGNVEFVVRNRLGFFVPDPEKLRSVVDRVLRDADYHEAIQHRIADMEIQSGTDRIVEFILRYSSDRTSPI